VKRLINLVKARQFARRRPAHRPEVTMIFRGHGTACLCPPYDFVTNTKQASHRHCEERCDEAIHASASGEMDCFAEPVIGGAFARPVGSQ